MTQMKEARGVATRIYTDDEGYTCIQYHATIVVRFNNDRIILNNGGYRTRTTKNRMNQAANQFDLRFAVYQDKRRWYVTTFADRINYSPDNVRSRFLFEDREGFSDRVVIDRKTGRKAR